MPLQELVGIVSIVFLYEKIKNAVWRGRVVNVFSQIMVDRFHATRTDEASLASIAIAKDRYGVPVTPEKTIILIFTPGLF